MLQLQIAGPLLMKNTVIQLGSDQKKLMSQGYRWDLKPYTLIDREILMGSGAVRSNAEDMMKWALAYLYPDKTQIAPAIKRSSEIKKVTDDGFKIGLGWNFTRSNNLYKDGMTYGYSSFIKIYPKDETVILYLTNTEASVPCFVQAAEELECRIK